MSRLRAISHIAFICRDSETSVEFYTAALGMTKAFEIKVPESLAAQGHPFAPLVGQVAIVYLRIGGRNFLELFRPLPDAETCRLGPNMLGMVSLTSALRWKGWASWSRVCGVGGSRSIRR